MNESGDAFVSQWVSGLVGLIAPDYNINNFQYIPY